MRNPSAGEAALGACVIAACESIQRGGTGSVLSSVDLGLTSNHLVRRNHLADLSCAESSLQSTTFGI
jgi:hypothetical protein